MQSSLLTVAVSPGNRVIVYVYIGVWDLDPVPLFYSPPFGFILRNKTLKIQLNSHLLILTNSFSSFSRVSHASDFQSHWKFYFLLYMYIHLWNICHCLICFKTFSEQYGASNNFNLKCYFNNFWNRTTLMFSFLIPILVHKLQWMNKTLTACLDFFFALNE